MAAARFFADPQNVAPHVAEVQRIEAKNLRPLSEPRQCGREIVGRCSADVT